MGSTARGDVAQGSLIPVVFTEDARADVLDAFDFYEEREQGLGERFRDHLDFAIAKVKASPERYPIVHRNLRRKLVERFPYAVFYRFDPGVIVVVAVMHGRQAPALWKGRAPQ